MLVTTAPRTKRTLYPASWSFVGQVVRVRST